MAFLCGTHPFLPHDLIVWKIYPAFLRVTVFTWVWHCRFVRTRTTYRHQQEGKKLIFSLIFTYVHFFLTSISYVPDLYKLMRQLQWWTHLCLAGGKITWVTCCWCYGSACEVNRCQGCRPVVMSGFLWNCECASCYARANLPRTVPKSYWSWLVANHERSIPTCTVVSPNTLQGAHASAFICLSG